MCQKYIYKIDMVPQNMCRDIHKVAKIRIDLSANPCGENLHGICASVNMFVVHQYVVAQP